MAISVCSVPCFLEKRELSLQPLEYELTRLVDIMLGLGSELSALPACFLPGVVSDGASQFPARSNITGRCT